MSYYNYTTNNSNSGGRKCESQGKANNTSTSEKSFSDLSYKEKLSEQLSRVTTSFRWESLPNEIQILQPNEFDRDETEEAAKVAIAKVMEKQKQKLKCYEEEEEEDEEEDEDGYVSEDSHYGRMFCKKFKKDPGDDTNQEEFSDFFFSLRQNYVFDMGFRVKGIKSEHLMNCWCPCSKAMMPWLDRFELNFIVEKYSSDYCYPDKMTAMGLMDHLASKKDKCLLHLGVDAYLRELYGNVRGVGHKALFKMGDAQYKRAEAMENKEKEELYSRVLNALHEEKLRNYELEREAKRKKAELDEFKRNLSATNEDGYKNIVELEGSFDALNVKADIISLCTGGDYNVDEEKTFDTLFQPWVMALKFGIPDPEVMFSKISIERSIDVENLDINAFLMKQFETARKLKSLNYNENWDIKKKEVLFNEGVPTRQFFSQFWDKMNMIEVKYNEKSVKLFTTTNSGVCPNMDRMLEDFVVFSAKQQEGKRREKTAVELYDQINYYYRAVGIVFFRAIVGQCAIAPSAMPRFLRNVLLRNCEPKDTVKYPSVQVLMDNKEMMGTDIIRADVVGKKLEDLCDDWSFDVSEAEAKHLITNENFITEFIQKINVDRYSRAIKYMRQGITLDGQADLTPLFSKTPPDLVSEKLFRKDSVSCKPRAKGERPHFSHT